MPLFQDFSEQPRKKLKFHCTSCGEEIVTRYLRPGDVLICKLCQCETMVPRVADETNEEPTYRKFVRNVVSLPTPDDTGAETLTDPTPWGLVSILKYYGIIILFFFTMTCLASAVVGFKYGFQKAKSPDFPPPAPDYSAMANSITLNIIGTFIGWFLSIFLIYYIVVKRHHNEFFKSLHLLPVSSDIIMKYLKIAIITVFAVLVLGFGIYYSPLIKYVPKELPIEKFLSGGYKEMIIFSVFAIIAPFPEELLYRGFLYKGLARSIGKIVAAIIVTSLFVLGHAGQLGYSILNLVLIAILATVLVVIRVKTDSLTKCVIVHQLYNTFLIIIMWIFAILFGFEHTQLRG